VKTIVLRESAADDLDRIDAWLSEIEGARPAQVRARIGAAISALERLGDIGRPSKVEGLRELSVRTAPYVITYSVKDEAIEIVAVFHTAQDR
jgi:plasmid stabilization system protein ParE